MGKAIDRVQDDSGDAGKLQDECYAIWVDIYHLERALWKTLYALDDMSPPPWRRMTKAQLQGIQKSMVSLIQRLDGYRAEAGGE